MDVAWMCVTRLSQSELLEQSTRIVDLSTVAGTAVDKARLLKGESTVITEQKLANHRWAEEALQKMMREFKLTREIEARLVARSLFLEPVAATQSTSRPALGEDS